MASHRRARRIVVGFAVVLLVLLVLVALAPSIAGAVGPGLVASAMEGRVRGAAQVDDLSLSWFGSQSVTGLKITDDSGREAVNLNATLNASLFALLLGSVDQFDVSLSGSLAGELREDGSTSFGELLVPGEKSEDAGEEPPSQRKGAPSLGALPAVNLEIGDLRVALDMEIDGKPQTLVLEKLTGHARYAPGGEAEVRLDSPTKAGDLNGSVAVHAIARDLFDEAGDMTPRGAALDANILAKSLPVPFAGQVTELRELALEAKADDLTERLDCVLRAETLLAGSEPSLLDGAVSALAPLAADGSINLGLDALTGEVTGQRVPSALAQPFLTDTPLLLSRDLGDFIDVTASFSPGQRKDIRLALTAENASLEFAGTVQPDGAVYGDLLDVTVSVQPALISELAALTIDRPATVIARLGALRVPAADENGSRPLNALAIDGRVELPEPVRVTVEALRGADFTLEGAEITFSADTLGDGLRLTASTDVDEGRIEVDQDLTNLFDESGELAIAAVQPVGRVTLRDLDAAKVEGMIEEMIEEMIGESNLAPVIHELLKGSVNAVLVTERRQGDLAADLEIATDAVQAGASVIRRPDALQIDSVSATLTATPQLVAALQEGGEQPVVLGAPTSITVTVEPLSLPGASFDEYKLPEEPLRATVTMGDVTIEHAALAEPLAVGAMTAALTAQLGEAPSYAAKGEARLDRPTAGRTLGTVRYDLAAETVDEKIVPRGEVMLEGVAVADLEALAGMEEQALAAWVGAAGNVGVVLAGEADARRVTVRSELPNLTGEVRASLADDAITADAEDLRFTVQKATLEKMLNPPPPEGEEGEEGESTAEPILVAADVPVSVSLKRLHLPLAMMRGEAFDPGDVDLDATLTGDALKLADAQGVFLTFKGLSVDVNADDLSRGVRFTLNGSAVARGAERPGEIAVGGSLVDLVTDESTFSRTAAKLDLDGSAEHVPTALADSLMGLKGLLVAAVGEEMNATFTSSGFSPDAGQLEGRLETTNGFLEGRIRGKNQAFFTTTAKPLHGELAITPPLRQRLLSRIHPILADIRTTEQPIRLNVPTQTWAPLDGDLRRMKGDLQITIGAVEFDSGSLSLGLLSLFHAGKPVVEGYIEPIIVKIRKGVISYDRFDVRIDKYTLSYTGSIDLKTQTIDLRTKIPLEALAGTFNELEGYVDKITVPLVTRGTFEDNKTEIDPDFDLAAAAAEAGFRGALDELLKGKGVDLDNILGDLLGGKKGGGK